MNPNGSKCIQFDPIVYTWIQIDTNVYKWPKWI